MQRVMVIGGPGAGKSTLALGIGDRLGLPVVHMDALLWMPGWQMRDEDEFLRLATEAAAGEAWVIDGNYTRTQAARLEHVEMIVFLDLPHWLRMWRILKRRIVNHGRTRADLGEDCPERLNGEFLRWCWDFESKRAPVMREKVKLWSQSKQVVHLKSRAEVARFLDGLN